jgi:hypothetical protein
MLMLVLELGSERMRQPKVQANNMTKAFALSRSKMPKISSGFEEVGEFL